MPDTRQDPQLACAADPGRRAAQRRALRTIALFEAVKGVAALAASLGLLGLVHRDLHHLVEALIGRLGLDPGEHYPSILLHDADLVKNADLRSLLLLAGGYVSLRFAEAYGLWRERIWGQWLGALSGSLYIPFELHHWYEVPSTAGAVVLAVNVLVVLFLAWQLWRQRARPRGGPIR
jgi:uncharacterized membrane protein (DUF2068 family)